MNPARLLLAIVSLVSVVGMNAQSFTYTPNPVSTAANPILLNVGQNYPSAASFIIAFNQAGGTISRIEVRGALPPGLTLAGGQLLNGILVLESRASGVIQGVPTTPGDYVVRVEGVSQSGLRSDSQGNL